MKAVAKKKVEFQGGAIGIESEPGKGSTCTVVMPRAATRKSHETDAPSL